MENLIVLNAKEIPANIVPNLFLIKKLMIHCQLVMILEIPKIGKKEHIQEFIETFKLLIL